MAFRPLSESDYDALLAGEAADPLDDPVPASDNVRELYDVTQRSAWRGETDPWAAEINKLESRLRHPAGRKIK